MRERNKITDEDGKVEGRDYEWVELPSFDDPSKTIRIKKYNDCLLYTSDAADEL